MTAPTSVASQRLSSDEILRIARLDAERVYRDLSPSICIAERPDGWHVDYELKDDRTRGGGPRYVIHPISGEIVERRYEQ
jgi:hypothetical protein